MRPRFLLFLILVSLAPAQQTGAETYRGGIITPPLIKPRFVLTDTSGVPFDFWRNTQGYVTLLFFGYTYCPDQCPMHMGTLGAALKALPTAVADQVKLVFVTTDPARDWSRRSAPVAGSVRPPFRRSHRDGRRHRGGSAGSGCSFGP